VVLLLRKGRRAGRKREREERGWGRKGGEGEGKGGTRKEEKKG